MPKRPPVHRPAGWKPAERIYVPERDDFYHAAEWRRLRAAVKKRDRYRCVMPDCETPGRGGGGRLTVDHVVPRDQGGPDAMHNLRTLCSACDGKRHRDRRWG